ncbi:MAG: CHC2 zinc finger domain-containing protein [Candidatus Eisenbacteria bacterium]|nr:CHC2 zinc finger domain-containing protein [Candidatus Eisenbacteria bacterium]
MDIFPEAKGIIPEKIREWEQQRNQIIRRIRIKLTLNKYYIKGELEQCFWREWIKVMDGKELLRVEGHIARLRRLLSVDKGRIPEGRITEEDIKRALAVPIESLLGRPFRKSGRALVTLCPLHDESHPSFYIYQDTNSCWCYGCNQGGDAITFVRLLRGYSFKEAVKYLTGE